ncbi:MAG TPA: DUF1385 domain-containing protein [Anaerolineaceae bacterium]|nr:DUF1385 domain-containing protein [Anaerolineaceae bacterium]
MSEKLPNYGGQALIEGVLMRGSRALAAAMRDPDGKIVVQTEPLQGIYTSKIAKLPFLRGLVILWDSLGLGMRYLTLSANVQTGEDEKLEGPAMYGTVALSLLIAVAIFFVAPAALGHLLEGWLGISTWWSNFLEGLIRLGLMIGYIWLIGRMPEIARVFAYHGAEHKTINAFEAGANLTPENVSRYSLEHPRCGTSFLLTLILLSIILFAALGPMPVFWRLASRVLLIPVLTGFAYEYIRWVANHLGNPIVRLLVRPNLALQRLTTREPSLDILEVAITSFNAMLVLEKELTGEASPIMETTIEQPIGGGSL